MALEEWRHWLEGAPIPFQVWSDHKNLEYLQTAKRLTPCKARWALFFGRFNFYLAYRPGSKNTKPDALSRRFGPPTCDPAPDTILRPEVFISTINIETTVRSSLGEEAAPSACPDNCLFIPVGVRPQVLLWGHSSNLSCHPGISRTVAFIERKFWWPELRQDIKDCAQAKPSHRPPSDLLQPLPIPHRPWSHIALDFMTGLHSSNHHTTILTIVDRFSQTVHFILLIKLPSASETATLLITHIVRLHVIPTDMVSDRGPPDHQIDRITSPTTVNLRLPLTMRHIHPTFHVSVKTCGHTSSLPSSCATPASTCHRRGRHLHCQPSPGLPSSGPWPSVSCGIREFHKNHPIPPVRAPRGAR